MGHAAPAEQQRLRMGHFSLMNRQDAKDAKKEEEKGWTLLCRWAVCSWALAQSL
jgi:hypothetical protein